MAQSQERPTLAQPRPAPPDPDEDTTVFAPRVANPFGQSDARVTVNALTSIEQQRQIAEVQARMIVARSCPRDPRRCVDMIINECTRPTLAERALYSYSRGGTEITGPSIKLIEAVARHWGNIASGIKEISRQGQYSECVAYAWDLETGYYDERQYQVRHIRDRSERRGGAQVLTDERDIYELIANFGQRRKRATLQAVIPGDVVEAAVDQCEKTLKANADLTAEGLGRMLDAFEQLGVLKAHLEKRIQVRIEAIRPAQYVNLRKIYTSIQDGMSSPSDWFEIEESTASTTQTATTTGGNGVDPASSQRQQSNQEEVTPGGQGQVAEQRQPAATQQREAAGVPPTSTQQTGESAQQQRKPAALQRESLFKD